MAKPDRMEDLGRVRELLQQLVDKFDDKFNTQLDSKHGLENFEAHITKSHDESDGIEDLHYFLRNHKEKLEEILYIAIGDIYE